MEKTKTMEKRRSDKPHILIVDDEEGLRKMLQKGVRSLGYECSIAENAKKGLDVLDAAQVDVVITDIRMPGLSGIEFARIVKLKYKSDVIVFTGYAEDFTYEEVMEKGASDFIQKPVGIEELGLRLKRVLRERAVFEERNQAVEELEEILKKLKRTVEGIVHAMALTVETRDPYTAGHQTAVAGLASAIGKYMGLSRNQIEGISTAGLIHDIGKISVPAEILNKPGKLTDLEFSLIKEHPRVGYEILKQIEFPWPIADIVYQHHERMNGSGYPLGLSGEEILLEARILAVADVVEAMAAHRPYRPGLGIDKALEELSSNRAVLYDPDVVDACLALFKKEDFKLQGKEKSLESDHRD
jgi:putative two-component system response regulator